MEFSYKPVNPFQDDGLSKEDRAMINGMRNTAFSITDFWKMDNLYPND